MTLLEQSVKVRQDHGTKAYSKQPNNRKKEHIAGAASHCYPGPKTQ